MSDRDPIWDAVKARFQGFNYGVQTHDLKDDGYRARAVRRLEIEK